MSVPVRFRPKTIRRDGDDQLLIEWSDGVSGTISWRQLRDACPCASCREERGKPADPFRVLSDKELGAGPPQPAKMAPVGSYAYKVTWTDGHDTGIYTLEHLRELTTRPAP